MPARKILMDLQPSDIPISPLIFGHFIEFIENCMQGGVYDPGSSASDALNRECVRRTEQEEKGQSISVLAGTVCAVTINPPAE